MRRAQLLTLLVSLAAAPTALGQAATSPTVLELFTSQGCSSCPPADALLKTYIERPGVMALSMPVDYWDHLGWKDTLASPKNTARQKSYAKTLGPGNVYTPQLVIDGAVQAIGSNKVEIEKALRDVAKTGRPIAVNLTATSDGKRMTIEVGASTSAVPATIWLAVVTPRVEVEIKRGENRGRMLAYHNVVREISPIGMWAGNAMKVELPTSVLMQPTDRCAVLLQADNGGRILGSTWLVP